MHNPTVFSQGYTQGDELFIKSTGVSYIGWYHVLSDGRIMSGPNYNPDAMDSLELMAKNGMPENSAGELISNFTESGEGFEGVYQVLPIKNYKNDIDIVAEVEELNVEPPVITLQPDLVFKKNTTTDYEPGKDTLIDDGRNIRVYRGKQITLQFNFNSFDTFENIKFEWFDSFDRLVSTEPFLVVDTNTIEPDEETYYCVVTDSYGTDTTNEVTINIIDDSNPFIYKNVIKNSSANDSTADWETIGDNPEETGKFLPNWQESVDPFTTTGGGRGTYFYHKFSSGFDGFQNKNQWYPRPEIFDAQNGFQGSVISEIKDNYFKGGVFTPIVRRGENTYSGITKTSVHTVDLTEIADLIDGKVYGLKGFKTTLFGWIGTRADQADYGDCTFEFLDENDLPIFVPGNLTISSLRWFDRTVNDYPRASWFSSLDSKIMGGYYDTSSNFDYSGIIFDANAGALYDRYQVEFTDQNGNIRGTGPEVKTCIVGRNTDVVEVPVGTRRIRITKRYNHEAGVYDLIWQGDEWQEKGIDYVSDLMFVGLNIRMYPILIDDAGNEIDTSLKPDGSSVISGMKFLEEVPGSSERSYLATWAIQGNGGTLDAYLNSQELRVESIDDLGVEAQDNWFSLGTDVSTFDRPGVDGVITTPQMEALFGSGWTAYTNQAMQYFVSTKIGGDRNRRLNDYAFTPGPDGIGSISDFGTSIRKNYTRLIEAVPPSFGANGNALDQPSFKSILNPLDINGEPAYDDSGVKNPNYTSPGGASIVLFTPNT